MAAGGGRGAAARPGLARRALTGLLNHAAFHDRLSAATRSPARGGRPVALVLADLDHLKHTNDTYGHRVGDAALRAVADALAQRRAHRRRHRARGRRRVRLAARRGDAGRRGGGGRTGRARR